MYRSFSGEARGRELISATIRSDFLRSWAAYKQARLKGDAETILRFHPVGHIVRSVRGDNVYLVHRKAAEREAHIRYRVFEDIEGPYVVIAPSGCCIWAVTRTKAVPQTNQPSEGAPPPEEGDTTSIQQLAGASDGANWKTVAQSNAIEDPRRLSAGQLIDLPR